MKNKKNLRRIISGILSIIMIATSIPSSVLAESFVKNVAEEPMLQAEDVTTKLVNIAPECEITVPSTEDGHIAENMVDGDPSTMWIANGSNFPSTIMYKLPSTNMDKVKKVVVKFENTADTANRSMNVTLKHGINSVIGAESDWVLDKTVENHKLQTTFEYEYLEASSISHQKIILDNPISGAEAGQFYPAIAEVEIYVEREVTEPAGEVVNIAGEAKISSTKENDGTTDTNLVDGDYGNLYILKNGAMDTNGAYAQFDFTDNKKIKGFEIAFEHVDPDSNSFEFVYDILVKAKGDADWTTVITDATATRIDNIKQHELDAFQDIASVKVFLKAINKTAGDPWPAMAEVKIFAQNSQESEDDGSIAYKKPVHSNGTTSLESKVNDGSATTAWTANMYPAYVDIDLEKNYNLSSINILTSQTGYYQYTIYTSMDGKTFDRLVEKQDKISCPEEGITYDLAALDKVKEARIVRVYMEYNSNNSKSSINEVRVYGEESKTPIQERPQINVQNFTEDVEHNQMTFTEEETIEEVKAIVARTVGAEYVDWFKFQIEDNPNRRDYDFYSISNDVDGKILIKGNNGVSLATGLNYYYKYYCKVNIAEAQVPSQTKMPVAIVPVEKAIIKETKLPVRYAFNYCTQSYSMAFWGEEEWQAELDWLALNGVNLVLDIVGQEEVWRRFLNEIGYTDAEAKDFLAGPAYYAWAYMANLTGAGGPLPDTWFEDRVQLARDNQLKMRKLGMEPIMQGYSGMVPVDIATKDPEVQVIPQGGWCSYTRPYMLKTTTQDFDDYADIFYRVQKEVYGTGSHHYATDPFHEGGNQGGMSSVDVASNVMDAMLRNDETGVWIIQGWLSNPTNDLLKGLEGNRDHALVLDLYSEQRPNYRNDRTIDGVTKKEFFETPWVYCMLNNFGGRMGLNGNLDEMAKAIPEAINEYGAMAGVGITPEATQGNPMLYDFIYETIWSETPDNVPEINIQNWIKEYQIRRYGKESQSAYDGLIKVSETAYKHKFNTSVQGASESVINAQPALSIGSASSWGSCTISYSKKEFEKAAQLLLQDYDKLKESKAYIYDVVDVFKQVLSNTAQERQSEMAAAFSAGDITAFETKSTEFLALIDTVDTLLRAIPEFRLGTWTTNAQEMGEGKDDFAKDLYLFNAKALLTTWGSKQQRDGGGLRDYSNRQWAELTGDFYKARWTQWVDKAKENLAAGNTTAPSIDWFEWEWEWVRSDKSYTNEADTSVDVKAVANHILENYLVPVNPGEDDTNDIDRTLLTATAASEQSTTGIEGPASNVLDNDESTIWHTVWAGTTMENLYITLSMTDSKKVTGMRYKPRPALNGRITGYKVEISNDHGETWKEVTEGTWDNNATWKLASWEAVEATDVRLYPTDVQTDSGALFASAAEMRLTEFKENVPTTYAVSFEKGATDASGTIPTIEAQKEGATFTLPANPFTRAGYTFVGWSDGSKNYQAGATYTMQAKAVTFTAQWTKNNVAVQSVTLSKDKVELKVGADETITATVNPSDATDKTVTWTTDKPLIATVTNGKITAKAEGTAKITATAGGKSAVCTVTVTKADPIVKPVESVTLSKDKVELKVGANEAITATVNPSDATDKTVTWTTDQPAIATVTNGKITAKAEGTAKITATAGGKSAVCTVTVTKADPIVKPYTGWKEFGKKWKYLVKDVPVKNKWVLSKGAWYYIGKDEFMMTNWQLVDERWYYLEESGAMATGWTKVDQKWYYLKDNGVMATGWVKVDQKWYYLKANGVMATGWAKVDQKWYYLKDNGVMVTGWAKVDQKWYYLKANGVMATSWVKVAGKWYYLKNNGVMARDWVKVSGKWYYLKDNGVMATGWIKVRGTWYYLKKDGSMATNWTFDGKKLYYLNVTNGAWNGQVK